MDLITAYLPLENVPKKSRKIYKKRRNDTAQGFFPKKTKYAILYFTPDREIDPKSTFKHKLAKAILKKQGKWLPWYVFGMSNKNPLNWLMRLIALPFLILWEIIKLFLQFIALLGLDFLGTFSIMELNFGDLNINSITDSITKYIPEDIWDAVASQFPSADDLVYNAVDKAEDKVLGVGAYEDKTDDLAEQYMNHKK